MEIFDGPKLTPPRVSLLSAADLITPESDRWAVGFDLLLEGVETHGIYAVCPVDADPKEFSTEGDIEPYNPVVIYATDACTTFTRDRDYFGRAERKLLTAESTVLEEMLWLGTAAFGATNPFLTDTPTTIAMTSPDARDAFAKLEQAIGGNSATRGMIHLRPQILVDLVRFGVVRREGNVYLSPMDNLVVPGRGYPGTGPANEAVGATEWMYGHAGIVQVRRGPIGQLGANDLASTVIRSTNDRQVIVERVAHVALDTTKTVFAIEFDSIV